MNRNDEKAKNFVHIPPEAKTFEILRDITDSKILNEPSEGKWDIIAEKLNPHKLPKTTTKTGHYYINLKDLECGHFFGKNEKICALSAIDVVKERISFFNT